MVHRGFLSVGGDRGRTGHLHAEAGVKLGVLRASPSTRLGCTADGINEAGKDRKEPFAQLTMAHSYIYSSKCTKVKLSCLDQGLIGFARKRGITRPFEWRSSLVGRFWRPIYCPECREKGESPAYDLIGMDAAGTSAARAVPLASAMTCLLGGQSESASDACISRHDRKTPCDSGRVLPETGRDGIINMTQ